MRRIVFVIAVVGCSFVRTAEAQIPVTDVANLIQAIIIAARTQAHLETLRAQYQTILRMGEGLGSMEGYQIPTIAVTRHDPFRFEFGRSWLQALNSGDPTGASYLRTARRLERPGNALDALPDEARRAIEQAYATIEITDSVSSLAGHQVGALRGYPAPQDHVVLSLIELRQPRVFAFLTYGYKVLWFPPRAFTELRNGEAIVMPYDGVKPLPPQYCYLKPHYLDVNTSYFDHAARGDL